MEKNTEPNSEKQIQARLESNPNYIAFIDMMAMYYHNNPPTSESLDMDNGVIEIKVGKCHATLALTSETWKTLTDDMKKIAEDMK